SDRTVGCGCRGTRRRLAMPAIILPREERQIKHAGLKDGIAAAEEEKDHATATALKAEWTAHKAGKPYVVAPPPAPIVPRPVPPPVVTSGSSAVSSSGVPSAA